MFNSSFKKSGAILFLALLLCTHRAVGDAVDLDTSSKDNNADSAYSAAEREYSPSSITDCFITIEPSERACNFFKSDKNIKNVISKIQTSPGYTPSQTYKYSVANFNESNGNVTFEKYSNRELWEKVTKAACSEQNAPSESSHNAPEISWDPTAQKVAAIFFAGYPAAAGKYTEELKDYNEGIRIYSFNIETNGQASGSETFSFSDSDEDDIESDVYIVDYFEDDNIPNLIYNITGNNDPFPAGGSYSPDSYPDSNNGNNTKEEERGDTENQEGPASNASDNSAENTNNKSSAPSNSLTIREPNAPPTPLQTSSEDEKCEFGICESNFAETPGEKSENETRAEAPSEKPAEAPAEKPAEKPTWKPKETTTEAFKKTASTISEVASESPASPPPNAIEYMKEYSDDAEPSYSLSEGWSELINFIYELFSSAEEEENDERGDNTYESNRASHIRLRSDHPHGPHPHEGAPHHHSEHKPEHGHRPEHEHKPEHKHGPGGHEGNKPEDEMEEQQNVLVPEIQSPVEEVPYAASDVFPEPVGIQVPIVDENGATKVLPSRVNMGENTAEEPALDLGEYQNTENLIEGVEYAESDANYDFKDIQEGETPEGDQITTTAYVIPGVGALAAFSSLVAAVYIYRRRNLRKLSRQVDNGASDQNRNPQYLSPTCQISNPLYINPGSSA